MGAPMTAPLTPAERALLQVVRDSDEDHGGLDASECDGDELEVLATLCDRGLVEATQEFGEAPDGEEDEREMGATGALYRITGAGVAALRY
jgi:hypothetical protein